MRKYGIPRKNPIPSYAYHWIALAAARTVVRSASRSCDPFLSYEHGKRCYGEFDFLATHDLGRLRMVHPMYSLYQ